MSEGHLHASAYPLSKLWMEAEIVRERINRNHATTTSLMSTVIAAHASTGKSAKEAFKNLRDTLDKLNHD